ncbi:MAG: hypothetical protein J6V93_00595 [Clostridia bacterium]|nr:hypothetical protein [Clostridia bacterium]
MLYKKKYEPLSEADFKSPAPEYRGAPFWSWNTRLTPEILRRDIACLDKMGFGGFNMHPRAGMATEYLSDEYMECVKACVDEAKKRGMYAWLYDEDKWPSGFAGGYVTRYPRFRARVIHFCDHKVESIEKSEAVETGKSYFAGAYDIEFDSDNRMISYKRIGENDKAEYYKLYAYCECSRNDPWFNNSTYVDTLRSEAIDKFVEITHERYKEHVGADFGGVIPAVFTDEPQYHVRTYEFHIEKTSLPIDVNAFWSFDFDESFERKYGYDIIDRLPDIILESASDILPVARYHYYDHLSDRFSEAFAKTCGDWCKKNGLIFSGHVNGEHGLDFLSASTGDPLRFYKHMQIPGVDVLCDKREFMTLKQCQSAVHQYGREGMLSELYGVTGWDFDFRGHKLQGDWQAALGVTVRVPHLSWLSMNGAAKRDYPASIGHQSAWYTEYSYVENHFARLGSVLTRGKPHVKLGVIFPIEGYWLNFGPHDLTGDKRRRMEEDYNRMLDGLLFNLIDFDLISESLLPEQTGRISNELEVGEMKYTTVLLPALEAVRTSTVEILEKFLDNGGKVVFAGDCPRYVDGILSDRARALYDRSKKCRLAGYDICEAVKDERIIDIRLANGMRTSNFIYNMRREENCDWLFISRCVYQSPVNDCSRPESISISIKGEYKPTLYDTVNGEIKEVGYRISDGYTYINTVLYSHDSLLYKLEAPDEREKTVCSAPAPKLIERLDFKRTVGYERSEDNVVMLDRARWSLDGEALNGEEELLKIDNLCRVALGMPQKPLGLPQPWAIPPEEIKHSVRLVFEINSVCELNGVKLALEKARDALITFNGEAVYNTPVGYYIDECFDTVKLPVIKKGANTLELILPFGMSKDLEWCYLVGDFDVELKGVIATLKEPSHEIAFGSIVPQGLPFYTGVLTYKTGVELPSGRVSVRVNRYRGAIVRVSLDGVDKGCIVYDPYTLDLGTVEAGHHEVEFRIYLTRGNTFASVHNISGELWKGPGHWYSKGDRFCYEYVLSESGILSSPVIEVFDE